MGDATIPFMKLKKASCLLIVFFASWAAAGTLRASDSPVPGSASGTFSIDGKAVALHHAYAMRQPDVFDETKTDLAILLTEEPVPDKTLEGLKDLEGASWGKGSSLFLRLNE